MYTNSTGGLDDAEWGAVCGDYWWNFFDARVVCRQLGYPDALVAIRLGPYGEGNGPYRLYYINCIGTETDIFTCDHFGIENHFCYYGSAGAHCLGTCITLINLLNTYVASCSSGLDSMYNFTIAACDSSYITSTAYT